MKTKTRLQLILITCIATFLPPALAMAQWWGEWTKSGANPVVAPSMVTWFENSYGPSVIFDDGVYRMWFTGWTAEDIHRNIGYAESVNGMDWDIYAEPVLTCNVPNAWNKNKYMGTVIRTDDTLRMYYTGFNTFTPFAPCIGYAWSLDGIAWTCLPQAILPRGEAGEWDENLVENPAVMIDDGMYHMWYDNGEAIGHATSLDGIVWEKDITHNPIMYACIPGSFYESAIHAGPVIPADNMTHMFIGGLAADNMGATGHAWSDNLYGWTITEGPVLNGDPGDWDAASAFFNTVLQGNGMMLAWYTGTSTPEDPQYAIGLAMSEIVGTHEFTSNTGKEIVAFPNPSRDQTLWIRHDNSRDAGKKAELRVFNSLGQEVWMRTIPAGESESRITTRNWEPGPYFAILFIDGRASGKVTVILE